MEDCWLEQEEFNFDIPLSPLGENEAVVEKSLAENDDEDEVFFGPVGHMERCAAVVAEKDAIDPLLPLEPEKQALLLQESVALSVMLKHKPLTTSKTNSPVAVVFPIMKKESSNLSIKDLEALKSKPENKENTKPQEGTISLHINQDDCNRSIVSKTSILSDTEMDKGVSRKKDNVSASQQSRLNRSFGADKLKQTGIPRVVDQKSKIARPSSIPSYKQSLLPGQPKLRSQANQESKMKPMKAMHINVKNTLQENPIKPQTSNQQLPTNAKSTPTTNFAISKQQGSNDAQQRHRRSIGHSPSLSKLILKNSSTPIRGNSTTQSSKKSDGSKLPSRKSISKSHITPRRSISDMKINPPKDHQATNDRRQSARRSLLPKQLKSSKDESPVSSGSFRRRSISKTTLNVSTPISLSDERKQLKGIDDVPSRNSITRSETFILNDLSKHDNTLIDIPMKDDNPKNNLALYDDEKENELQNKLSHSDLNILKPESAVRHQSPLLKFDSPITNNIANDPFATGDTPPPEDSALLCPVQVQKDLIEF